MKELSTEHPFGVKPLGNQYGAKQHASIYMGYFRLLNEQLLLQCITALGPLNCLKLAQTCKALYCYCYHDDLWKEFVLGDGIAGDFDFQGDWKRTFGLKYSPIKVDLFSDILYASWRCSTIDVKELVGDKDTIDRQCGLSLEAFIRDYAIPNKPVIITDVVENWPAYKKWCFEYFADTGPYRCERVDLSFNKYKKYMDLTKDETPLYLFDKNITEELCADYSVPEYFSKDYFKLLPNRPDFRWVIMGPTRSGSTFHVDPNSTSAWNAVIKGAKKWILYPPNSIPPGVFPSSDGSEVTAPVSITDWFLNYYPEISKHSVKPIEAICREGEIIFIPNRWWHSVMNLEPTIAITQNFVGNENLKDVLKFLKCKADQVSGYCSGNLFEDFKQALQENEPDVWEQCQGMLEKKRKWDEITDTPFSFQF
jgi:hypothetical protein